MLLESLINANYSLGFEPFKTNGTFAFNKLLPLQGSADQRKDLKIALAVFFAFGETLFSVEDNSKIAKVFFVFNFYLRNQK